MKVIKEKYNFENGVMIAKYGSNGVPKDHSKWYYDLSEVESENMAKDASLKDPSSVYYVRYNDAIDSSSDLRWVNGKSYNSYSDARKALLQRV